MRLQFEIPEERVKEIDALVEKLGLKTRVQLFNNALTFFEWGVRQREEGSIIASINEVTGTYKELVMPVFPSVDMPRAAIIAATTLATKSEQASKVESTTNHHSPIVATVATEISGNDIKFFQSLSKVGVLNTQKLLEVGATPNGRQELAKETGINDKLLLQWVNFADLLRIEGIKEEYADLLEAAGVDTVPELAQRNPSQLHKTLVKTNQEKHLVRQPPEFDWVKAWVEQAKELPRIVHY